MRAHKKTPSFKDGAKLYLKRILNLLFKIFHQLADIKSDVGLVFVNVQLSSDFAAYLVVTFQLDVFSNFFSS